MKISETFESKFLRAADLNGRTIRVTIANIFSEAMQDGKSKPIVYFKNAKKGLVLNRTNAATIAMAYGDDTDAWLGADIELFPQAVPFQGQMQPAIRVRVPAERIATSPQTQPDRIAPNARARVESSAFDERNPPPIGTGSAPAAFDDDIPFAPEWR